MKSFSRVIPLVLSVALSAAGSLLLIHAIVESFGPLVWGATAVAQSIGLACAVVVGFGWSVVGAAEVGLRGSGARAQYLMDSVAPRVYLAAVALVIATFAIAAAVLLRQVDGVGLVLIAVSSALTGLGSAWFLVGEARMWRVLGLDSIPRAVGILSGSWLSYAGAPLATVGACMVAGSAAAALLVVADAKLRHRSARVDWSVRRATVRLISNWAGFTTSATASIYVTIPVLIVAWIAPAAVPVFALGDKVKGYALMSQLPVAQLMQSYVPRAHNNHALWLRIARVMKWMTVFALVFALGFAAFSPVLASLLSGARIRFEPILVGALSVSVFCVVLSGVAGPACLVALGAARSVATSTVLGAVVGLSLAGPLTLWGAAAGAAWAVAGAEVCVLAMQLRTLVQLRRTA